MSQQLITALRDCVSVMERELNGLAVIQPELKQAQQALASAEWNGTDLPPIGSVQHVEPDFRHVTVLAHGISLGEQVAICQDGNRILMALQTAFRTPEQIAAEERELAIKEIGLATGLRARDGQIEVATRLYEAGYRKVEGGAA